jgi:hypothetical protein
MVAIGGMNGRISSSPLVRRQIPVLSLAIPVCAEQIAENNVPLAKRVPENDLGDHRSPYDGIQQPGY